MDGSIGCSRALLQNWKRVFRRQLLVAPHCLFVGSVAIVCMSEPTFGSVQGVSFVGIFVLLIV